MKLETIKHQITRIALTSDQVGQRSKLSVEKLESRPRESNVRGGGNALGPPTGRCFQTFPLLCWK